MEYLEPLVPLDHAGSRSVFRAEWDQFNKPAKIVTLGHYYPQSRVTSAKTLVREASRQPYNPGINFNSRAVQDHVAWTRLINALNSERQWPLKRLYEMLDPILEPDIAIAVVPPHRAYQAFWPVRTLAQKLAANGRNDATSCLVRQTTIRRIIFGGPSTHALHRQTVDVENAELVLGRRVLLLDDIAKSGASLIACREMLMEAGAEIVQAVALGRVIVDAG